MVGFEVQLGQLQGHSLSDVMKSSDRFCLPDHPNSWKVELLRLEPPLLLRIVASSVLFIVERQDARVALIRISTWSVTND